MTSRFLRVSANHYEHAAPSFEAKYSVLPLDTNFHSYDTPPDSQTESGRVMVLQSRGDNFPGTAAAIRDHDQAYRGIKIEFLLPIHQRIRARHF